MIRLQFKIRPLGASVQAVVFILTSMASPAMLHAQSVSQLPLPGTMLTASTAFVPAMLRGIKVDENEPLVFDFILDKGQSGLTGSTLTDEAQKMIKYFLTALTVPEKDLWVNLSPYESGRVIPEKFGQTEMGRDLLSQDYILKQMTASLMYPQTKLGSDFWKRVYVKMQAEFGTTELPVDTFNKVWITPDKAKIYEKDNGVFIVENRLKVMLESDYLAMTQGSGRMPSQDLAKGIIREIILPELTREVNEGKNFAGLRQVYSALLLAAWYRQKVKDSILGSMYLNKNKIAGETLDDVKQVDKIYARYVEAFKKGVYNYVKEDVDPVTDKLVAHQYFSGGMNGDYAQARIEVVKDDATVSIIGSEEELLDIRVGCRPATDMVQNVSDFPSNMPNVLDQINIQALMNSKKSEAEKKDFEAALANAGSIQGDMVTAYTMQLISASSFIQQELGASAQMDTIKVRVLSNPDLLPKGYALDRDNRIIYITTKLDYAHKFAFFARKVIELLSSTPSQGRQLQYKYVKNMRGEEMTREVLRLFPENGEPEQVLAKIKNELLFTDDIVSVAKLKQLAAEIMDLSVDEVEIDRELSLEAKEVVKEALQVAEESLYIIAVNAIDGVDYKKQVDSLDSVKDAEAMGQLSSKFAPISIAHMIVTILRTYALSGVNSFTVNVSEFDPNKPEVHKSYSSRKQMADKIIQHFFGGLVQILKDDRLNSDGESEFRVWNGEEVFIKMILEAVKTNKNLNKVFVYTAGGDHFYIWAPADPKFDVINLIQFNKVTDKTRKYFTFYSELSPQGYRDLVLQQAATRNGRAFFVDTPSFREQEFLNHANISFGTKNSQMAKQKKFYQDMLAAKDDEAIKKVVEEAEYLPKLDTAGKMYLAQKVVGTDVQIVLEHTNRAGENQGDAYRDLLIENKAFGVRNVEGLQGNIAATYTRMGLREFALSRGKKFSFSLLFGNVKSLLKEVFVSTREGRRLLYVLLRQEGVELPYAMETLVPAKEDARLVEAHKLDLLKELQAKIFPGAFKIEFNQGALAKHAEEIKVVNKNGVVLGWYLEHVNKGGHTHIHVHDMDKGGKAIAFLEYTVTGKFDAEGNDLNIINIKKKSGDQEIVAKIEDFVKGFNNSNQVVDAGQMTASLDSTDNAELGGIDLDTRKLKLDISHDGQPMKFKFDPAMFNNGHFDGITPIIFDVTPIKDLPMFLGQKVASRAG